MVIVNVYIDAVFKELCLTVTLAVKANFLLEIYLILTFPLCFAYNEGSGCQSGANEQSRTIGGLK